MRQEAQARKKYAAGRTSRALMKRSGEASPYGFQEIVPEMTPEEMAGFEADMDALAEGSENWPVLPPEAFSRASIYEERG